MIYETSVLQHALSKLMSQLQISRLSVRFLFPVFQFRMMNFLPNTAWKNTKECFFLGGGAFFEPNRLFVFSLNHKTDKSRILGSVVLWEEGWEELPVIICVMQRKPGSPSDKLSMGTVQVWLLNGVQESNLFKAVAELTLLGITY